MIKFNFYIHPHFILKYYLLRDLKWTTINYKFNGKVIDIGCGEKPYSNLFKNSEYAGIDFKTYSRNNTFSANKPDYYFGINYKKNYRLPFKSKGYNHSVSFQVLEHHAEPQMMISEMVRITKKNGYILLSVPFIGGLHEEPHDYFRYTPYALLYLFKKNNCDIVFLKKQGSLASTLSIIFMDGLINFANKNKVSYVVSILLFPFFLLISYLSFPLDKLLKTDNVFMNYVLLAKKN